ncbi:AraC-like ligand-binding domain-containing protein [Streptacidiphilus fuscans]|uniref:Helix-turn-helix domain-containing protein n=1 Tax=Streptacidiphilus fuscans TaxID=2789292 RepID=A0A931FAS2_9ACTN|nr:helix-turn-helix domain-containing protein [Streptacidiphilus fuscans]MBF9066693.1 helix-turn-helix domain-containing protein [Streptacidiphilus fuscans]
MALVIDTGTIPERERLEAWSQALAQVIVPVKVASRAPGALLGQVRSHRLGYMRTASLVADPQRISRPPSLCVEDRAERFALALQSEGETRLTQEGRSARLGPDDMVLLDLRRPFALDFPQPFRLDLVHLPQRALGGPRTLEQLAGRTLPADGGPASALRLLLRGTLRAAGEFRPVAAERLAGHVADLVDAIAFESRDEPVPTTAREHLVPLIRDHVDAHLGDPDLGPESVAEAFRISVRYLHRLFEGQDLTVARLIQQRRVAACARELDRHGHRASSVAAVARRHGFTNAAHFSRAFRAAYGVSPRVWRARGGPSGGDPAVTTTEPATAAA